MSPEEFPARERPQTIALARAAARFGIKTGDLFFEVHHPRCVSNNSNYKVSAFIVKHNYILGGMLFTTCKAQLHVSATNVPWNRWLQEQYQRINSVIRNRTKTSGIGPPADPPPTFKAIQKFSETNPTRSRTYNA